MPAPSPVNIVIGSGHAGVAAAAALVAQGRRVLMLDAGEAMAPASMALRQRLAASEPPQWTPGDVEMLTGRRRVERADTIRPYGSDHVFRLPDGAQAWAAPGDLHALRPSFAKGGLSNGWGASVLPYRDDDLADWPIGVAELAPHYAAVTGWLPIAARDDDLAEPFPLYGASIAPLPLSAQAADLLGRLDARRAPLARLGVRFGQSRQAIAAGCRQCAMCLHGCPYGLIFNAGDRVDTLVQSGKLAYRPGAMVVRFQEDHAGVRVWVREAGAVHELHGDRLFVAAGVLPTALLVLDSLDRADERVALQDSQHFYLPMLHAWRNARDPAAAPRHALAQLFVEIVDPRLSPHTVHVQLYTHNDNFAPDMRLRFGRLAAAMEPVVGVLSRRLIVAQSFLHSRDSPGLAVTLQRQVAGARLTFAQIDNAATAPLIARVRRRLARIAMAAGLLPLLPLTRLGGLGSSFHCGGSFPMRRNPAALETDTLGRLPGLRRVHIVDASVFPSIPATTIAFSAMANAHRIATESMSA